MPHTFKKSKVVQSVPPAPAEKGWRPRPQLSALDSPRSSEKQWAAKSSSGRPLWAVPAPDRANIPEVAPPRGGGQGPGLAPPPRPCSPSSVASPGGGAAAAGGAGAEGSRSPPPPGDPATKPAARAAQTGPATLGLRRDAPARPSLDPRARRHEEAPWRQRALRNVSAGSVAGGAHKTLAGRLLSPDLSRSPPQDRDHPSPRVLSDHQPHQNQGQGLREREAIDSPSLSTGDSAVVQSRVGFCSAIFVNKKAEKGP